MKWENFLNLRYYTTLTDVKKYERKKHDKSTDEEDLLRDSLSNANYLK